MAQGWTEVYVDGSCFGCPGPAGWGAVVLTGAQAKKASKGVESSTPQIIELIAAVEGLRLVDDSAKVVLFTDCLALKGDITTHQYALEGRLKRENFDVLKKFGALGEDLARELARLQRIEVNWIPGHSNFRLNEVAHKLAHDAALWMRRKLRKEAQDTTHEAGRE